MKPTKKKPAKRKNGDTPKGMLIMKLKKISYSDRDEKRSKYEY